MATIELFGGWTAWCSCTHFDITVINNILDAYSHKHDGFFWGGRPFLRNQKLQKKPKNY